MKLTCLARTAFVIVALGSAAPPLKAQEAAAVIKAIEAFHEALASGDSVKALSLLADDVVILESGGTEDKSHYRSGHLSGDMRFAQAVPRERSEVDVRILGDVAWATSTSVTQGRMSEREINSQGAELAVLARDGASWKITAIHWSSRNRRE